MSNSLLDENCIKCPSWETALSLDLPNIAINLISLETMQMCSQGQLDAIPDLYHRTGAPLAKKYSNYPVSRIAISLGRAENPDLNVMTCMGNMYFSIASAHIIRASQEFGTTRAASITRAYEFMELASDAFCRSLHRGNTEWQVCT